MALKYHKMSAHPSDLSDEQLWLELQGLANSEVMRSLLLAEVDAIRAGAEREERTMRGLWYALVKPALARLGILGQLTSKGKPVKWAADLSRYLGELVRNGHTTYEELRILDGSRQRVTAATVPKSVIEPVALVGAHFPGVILFTEKDTIWPVVRNLARLYGVSAISGGGKPSYACTENTIKAILQRPTSGALGHFELIALTDYDPSGYIISRAQHTQIGDVLGSLEQATGADMPPVAYQRIGLVPDQLSADDLAKNTYTPTGAKKELRDWMQETGGIEGALLGLELDALPLSRLRGMFAQAIEQVIDLDKRRADLRGAFLDLLACEVLLPGFEAKRAALQATIREGDLGAAIAQTDIPDSLFSAAARTGWDRIDPLTTEYNGGPLFEHPDQVREAMRERLAELQENGGGGA